MRQRSEPRTPDVPSPGYRAALSATGSDPYTFTEDQIRRYAYMFGPADAQRRIRTIAYQYLAARRRFAETCIDEKARVFVFERSVELADIGDSQPAAGPAPTGVFFPHPDEPWLTFMRDEHAIRVYDNEGAASPYLDIRFQPGEWQTVVEIDEMPENKWVMVGDYPLRVCRVPGGHVYGQWL